MFQKNIKRLKDDSFLSTTLILALLCIGLHGYQFYVSHDVRPFLRLVFSVCVPLCIFFFGRLGVYWCFFVFANLLAINTTFQNYTPFIIIVIFITLMPKLKLTAFLLYALEIIFVATVREKTPVHIAIHTINCVGIYFAITYLLKPTINKKKLDLTVDEIYIIEEMLLGKQQKEIEKFSQNTVTNKLRRARERNQIATTDELLQKYKYFKNISQ